jgi:protocatechuate 3,4-dioxygenase beta subunit
MKRRIFLKEAVLGAVAISTAGFIRFNGTNYEGDCETTTDILGPFYRPDAPVRANMRINNLAGQLVVLSGQIKHKDCKTPLKNACVELWHCDAKGVYDNDSPDFKYRAKTYCDAKGNYSFKTIIPVPYDVGNGTIRPAHYHVLISAAGYQSLITQLYFTGDPYLSKDSSSSSPAAKRRILDIKNGRNGEKTVSFNVTMMEKLPADVGVIDRLVGIYTYTNDNKKSEEFYKKDGMIWIKDGSSINGGYPLEYSGNNTFEDYGRDNKYQFIIQESGLIKLSYSSLRRDKSIESWEAVKGR